MNKKLMMAIVMLLLLGITTVVIRTYADMTGCLPIGVCCPDDYPDACNDTGVFMGGSQVCAVCEMGCGKFGCIYNYWKWDTDYDGIHDCTETCFQGYVSGGCP